MLPYAIYLLKVIICSGILFGYYRLLLRNKIFHNYNRFYLLAAVVLSLSLPLVEINIWQNANTPAPTAIKLLQAVNNDEYLDGIIINARQNNFTAEQVSLLFYCITSIIFFCLFIAMLVRIRLLFVKHRHSLVENIYFVNTTAKGTPFSFLKYIFWNDLIDPESTTGNQIFKHELAHVQQKHSYDKLFINAVLIFCWCNPFFWLMRKELNMIHEFLADKIAVEDSDTEAFAAMILQATYPRHRFQLTNPFFYSPIKRRLLMLIKNRNSKAGYFGRVLVLPLAILVFAGFTLKTKTIKDNSDQAYNGKMITVVIDAGHGGSDKGVVSQSGNVLEKDLTLAITKKIKALNNNASINIVLTRETDIYQSPEEKAIFTKQQNADLFVSIHLNGASPQSSGQASGLSVCVSKDSYANSENSKLFASAVINEFSGNYRLPVEVHPQQQKMGIAVLQQANCPSVLIETGYITNNNDLAFLQTDAAKKSIANKILAAINKYAFAKDKTEPGIAIQGIELNENFRGEKIDTVPESNFKNLKEVLIIVDGKTSSEKELKKIDPQSIASINVLKDKSAVSKYGEKARKGVIEVNTKPIEISLTDPKKIMLTIQNGTSVKVDSPSSLSMRKPDSKVTVLNLKDPSMQPLYVIDGKVQNPGFNLETISPQNIESINVLKDQTATVKYGDKATNGVIEITTKRRDSIVEVNLFESQPVSVANGETTIKYNNNKESVTAVYAQSNTNDLSVVRAEKSINQDNSQINKVFTKAEYEPSFPGGDAEWRKYLVKNLHADLPFSEGWKPGTYKIVLTFIVNANGSVQDIKADNYAGTKTAEHCIDLIKKGPKWQPAVQNGHTVACYRKQPITFIVADK